MTTLFLAWQHATTRRWFPVGQLTQQGERYRFSYIGGVKAAQEEGGFLPLPDFPDLTATYESEELFPLFANRVMPASRPDFAEYITWLQLEGREKDPLAFLAETNGRRQTDTLEVFPATEPTEDGGQRTTFFVHGLRHMSPEALQRVTTLAVGEQLLLQWDAQNPVDPHAISLRTHGKASGDTTILGYCPRYLAEFVHRTLLTDRSKAEVRVQTVNPLFPPQYAIRCELRFHPGSAFPFEGTEFQPLVG